jgi:hypothetical protein
MYAIYRKSDDTYLGTVMNAKNKYQAERIAIVKYGTEVYIKEVK